MTYDDQGTGFHGLPVREFGAGADSAAAGEVAWRIRETMRQEDPHFTELFERLLDEVDSTRIRAIIVGAWGHSDVSAELPIGLLVEAAPRLPALEAIFLGDYDFDELELSWISQADVTPLLTAYPRLKRLDVRGSDGLVLRPVTHTALETLRFESGGLPASVVRAVGESTLPALRHLELWLGEENYGGDSGPEDWAAILAGEGLPALRHLGLQDSERQDEVAAAVATAPIVARLESLDLSMGNLGDEGAEALLSGQPLTHLRRLNLRHHFMSEKMTERLAAALTGVDVDMSEPQEEDEYGDRYIEVSE